MMSREHVSDCVKAFMKEMGLSDPEEAVREWARRKVAWARGKGWRGPRFDQELLADLSGIKLKPDTTGTVRNAMLVPDGSGRLTIFYNPNCSVGRHNFNVPHEVVHTAFRDRFDGPHYRAGIVEDDPLLERLCDIGASELLMPYPEFRNDLIKIGVGLDCVDAHADTYGASREATIRRIVHADVIPCAAVFISLRNKPRDAEDAPAKLRIDSFSSSGRFPGVHLPRHKSLPDDSIAYELSTVFDTSTIVTRARESWTIGGLPTCRVEAAWLSPPTATDDPQIVVLLIPQE